jgi:hypothetical protein
MRSLLPALLLGFGLAACGQPNISDVQTADVKNVGQPGAYFVSPADAVELTNLANTYYAGAFQSAAGDTFRVFELYEDHRIEVAIALQAGDHSAVWNLTEAIGAGVDEIDSIHQPNDSELNVWVYEESGLWAKYIIELSDVDGVLSMERYAYSAWFEPGTEGKAQHEEAYALKSVVDARYASLPLVKNITAVNFDHPTLGWARIFELDAEGNSQVVIHLSVGDDELVYDTDAVVREVTASYELEPGYFDMQTIPVCDADKCGWDAIGIDFKLSDDGKKLASPIIEVELKHGVG